MKRIAAALMMLVSLGGMSIVSVVGDLSWLSGRWVEEKGQDWTEENWAGPRGGVMLGTSLIGKGEKAGMYEFMRIAAGDGPGEIRFWASPAGKTPVPFRMTRRGLREVVFENPDNDYPTRIHYRREGRILTATISGPGGSNPTTWRYRRRG